MIVLPFPKFNLETKRERDREREIERERDRKRERQRERERDRERDKEREKEREKIIQRSTLHFFSPLLPSSISKPRQSSWTKG